MLCHAKYIKEKIDNKMGGEERGTHTMRQLNQHINKLRSKAKIQLLRGVIFLHKRK